MSTSKTYQQSLADAGSETRPPMLERGSYIPWASRFRRYLNRKRDNRKWLLKALDEGPYEFKIFTPEVCGDYDDVIQQDNCSHNSEGSFSGKRNVARNLSKANGNLEIPLNVRDSEDSDDALNV
ncbi:hypothetical protein Tco_1212899 [Tanacetum coccineum]